MASNYDIPFYYTHDNKITSDARQFMNLQEIKTN